MRNLNLRTWLVAVLALLLPCVAGAAGLGRLNVLSALGQPLVAEIDLVSVTKEEFSSLSARLLPPEAYQLANLQYNTALTGARVSLEKRPNGQPFLRITSSRPVTEPFIDLLVELVWAAGRLSREYTALLDPPSVAPAPPAPVISAVPESRPVPAPQPKVAAAPPAVSRPVTPAGPMAGGKEYGPIQRGETLGKIARSVMPEGVMLEQMLVALYRNNPEAFIRKNLNLVRTGKILRVPDREEVAAIARGEAAEEYRTHVADWNSYRQKLADVAGTVPAEGRTAVSGKITAKVEDKAAAGAPKDVVRLSKGEPPSAAAGKGKPRSTVERMRVLEEEVVAREKALAEANERIAQLEKTLKDMQKLVELKSPGMAAPKPEPATKPKPKPAPPPEPDLVDQILEALTDPLYLGAGGVVVLGGLAAFMLARRRRSREEAEEEPPSPQLGKAAAAAVTADADASQPAGGADAAAVDDVDPLAEAEVYIAYGRDGQAEEILKDALARNPNREDAQLKLLEIYSARKDKAAFGKQAGDVNKLTGGAGDNWLKAAAMGYILDPTNPLYAAGKDAAAALTPSAAGGATDVDLDLGLGDTGTATDIPLDAGAAQAAAGAETEILDLGQPEKAGDQAAAMPDFSLEVPPAEGAQTDVALEAAAPAQDASILDFQIELPKADAAPVAEAAPPAAASADAGLDFKLDGLSLSLEGEPKAAAPTPAGGEKDGHWYDVQTKFDLAKAYQEMGDKDGAKEILQEVIKEGDTEQKAQAKTLLDSLG